MNQTIYTNPGETIYGQDMWGFDQAATRAAFAAIMNSYALNAGDAFIVNGCSNAPDDGNILFQPGWVFMQNELFYFGGGIVPPNLIGQYWRWSIRQTNPADDPRLSADGQLRTTRLIRTVTIEQGGNPGYNLTDTIWRRINSALSQPTGYTALAIGNGWLTALTPLQYIKETSLAAGILGRISFIGQITFAGIPSGGYTPIVLPAGCRPPVALNFVLMDVNNKDLYSINIGINGDIGVVTPVTPHSDPVIDFSQISFLATQ